MIHRTNRAVLPRISTFHHYEDGIYCGVRALVSPVLPAGRFIQMENGTWGEFSDDSELTIDGSVHGPGGIDQGVVDRRLWDQSSQAWSYLDAWTSVYLIIDAGSLKVIASYGDPSGQISYGPTGYDAYRYLGSIRMHPADDIGDMRLTYQGGCRTSVVDHASLMVMAFLDEPPTEITAGEGEWDGGVGGPGEITSLHSFIGNGTPLSDPPPPGPLPYTCGRFDVQVGLDYDASTGLLVAATTYDTQPPDVDSTLTSDGSPFIGLSMYHSGNGASTSGWCMSKHPDGEGVWLSRGFALSNVDSTWNSLGYEDRYIG